MATSIKIELEQNKLRFDFYKLRNDQQPNHVNKKWLDIYADRVKKLERQLTKALTKSASQARH